MKEEKILNDFETDDVRKKKNSSGILTETASENKMIVCHHCHKEFSPKIPTQVFCSRRCRERDKEKRHDKRRTSRGVKIVLGEIHNGICPVCGNAFTYKFFGGAEKVYCSKKCAFIAGYRRKLNKIRIGSGKPVIHYHTIDNTTFVQKTEQDLENIRLGKFLHKQKLKSIRAENGKIRSKYYQDHPDEYTILVDKKKALLKERRDRKYEKLRNVSKRKARENLKRRVVNAKKYGIKTSFAVCKCCGDTFEYVAESYRVDSNRNVLKRSPIKQVPIFCCGTCKNWYEWNNGGKEKNQEYKKLREEKNKNKDNIITRWRGQYGSWYFEKKTNYIYPEDVNVDPDGRNNVVDLSQSLSTDMLASIDEI